MLRIIQHKILNSLGGDKKDDGHWKEGMTAKRIKNALNEFTARGLPGGHFFVDEISDDLKTILSAFNIESSFILPTMHELHKLKLTIDKATGVGL
jgi:hypothetical protein